MMVDIIYIIYRANLEHAFIDENVVLGFTYNEDDALKYVEKYNNDVESIGFCYYEPVERIIKH